ncbi:hypothetical protein Esti_001409 [Eimeria stiedai]
MGSAGEVSAVEEKKESHKNMAASGGSKLLKAEEPEVLRAHCEKCGCGEALRPGLDCRCHCPQCLAGKPRCSSPRTALRKQENQTCETFTASLTKANSRKIASHSESWSRRPASSDKAAPQKGLTCGSTTNAGFESAAPLKQESMGGNDNMSTSAFSRGQTAKSEKARKTKSRGGSSVEELELQMSKPEVFVRSESGKVKKGTFSAACSRARTKGHERAEVPEPAKEKAQEKPCEEESEALVKELPSAPGCKRGRSGCPKLAACSRYKTPASVEGCSTTQNFALWSDSGRLRELEMICYCDACIGLNDGTCTSPRMAKFKRTGAAGGSQSRQYTKTV